MVTKLVAKFWLPNLVLYQTANLSLYWPITKLYGQVFQNKCGHWAIPRYLIHVPSIELQEKKDSAGKEKASIDDSAFEALEKDFQEVSSLHSLFRQTSNIRRMSVGNETVDHSDADGASPGGAAPTTSSFST